MVAVILLMIFFGVLGSFFLSQKLFYRLISPFSLFVCVNSISFALCLMGGDYYNPLIFEVYLIFFFSNILFFVGHLFGSVSKYKIKQLDTVSYIGQEDFFIIVTGSIGLLGIVILGINILQRYDLAELLQTPALLQKNFQVVSGVGYMNTLNMLVLPVISYSITVLKKFKKTYFFFGLTSVIGMVLAGNKTFIMLSVLMAFYSWMIHQAKLSKVAGRVLIVVVFVVLYFVWYATKIDVGINYGSYVLRGVYRYLSGGWVALSELIKNEMHSEQIGYYTFYFFYKIKAFVMNESIGNQYMPFSNIPMLFNVYTINGELYSDFGIWGIVVGIFLYGIISAKIKKFWERYNKDFMRCIMYSVLLTNVTMTFFVNTIVQPYMIINILYLVLFGIFFRSVMFKNDKKNKKEV